MAYIKGIADPDLVDEVKKRLETIDIDLVIESAYIEQMIEDNWWSLSLLSRRLNALIK